MGWVCEVGDFWGVVGDRSFGDFLEEEWGEPEGLLTLVDGHPAAGDLVAHRGIDEGDGAEAVSLGDAEAEVRTEVIGAIEIVETSAAGEDCGADEFLCGGEGELVEAEDVEVGGAGVAAF